jgi:hypothetical protein
MLNGQRFSDAMLTPGDRLKIGPIELEVLSSSLPEQNLHGQESGQQQAEIEPQTDFRRHELKGHGAEWQQHREAEFARPQHKRDPARSASWQTGNESECKRHDNRPN